MLDSTGVEPCVSDGVYSVWLVGELAAVDTELVGGASIADAGEDLDVLSGEVLAFSALEAGLLEALRYEAAKPLSEGFEAAVLALREVDSALLEGLSDEAHGRLFGHLGKLQTALSRLDLVLCAGRRVGV